MRDQQLRSAKALSIFLAPAFAAVGLVFLVIPEGVLTFFNTISAPLGFPASPVPERNFYLILAAAYMWVVAWLAWKMILHPRDRTFPAILVQAKGASSLLSFVFFIFHAHFLIYLANALIDGFIGIAVAYFFLRSKSETRGDGAPGAEQGG